MRTTRLYCEDILCCGETIQLSTETSNHLIRVLRTKIGTTVILFNGDGFDYSCKTLDNDSRKTRLSIESKTEVTNESNLNITLIQGLSRNDRIETSIQKSVELGANKIIPVACQRSNTKTPKEKFAKKIIHWNKVAISACEQSGRCAVPEVSDILTINDIVNLSDNDALKIILDPEATTTLNELNTGKEKNELQSILIFIGPEGGLSNEELSLLQKNNFTAISFGPRILRTETAGPAVIAALQILWGDF